MTNMLLLVEDDKFVSAFVESVLDEGGYTILVVEDGNNAIARLEKRSDEIVGLITDIRLGPGPDGWEVARRARELKSIMAVVYMSGDSAGDWAAQGVPKSIMLQKPFVEAQLLTAISGLLIENDSSLG